MGREAGRDKCLLAVGRELGDRAPLERREGETPSADVLCMDFVLM